MNLKDAFNLVPDKFHGSPTIVYQQGKVLFSGVFISLKVHPMLSCYEVINEKEPFFIYNDLRKTITFNVK